MYSAYLFNGKTGEIKIVSTPKEEFFFLSNGSGWRNISFGEYKNISLAISFVLEYES